MKNKKLSCYIIYKDMYYYYKYKPTILYLIITFYKEIKYFQTSLMEVMEEVIWKIVIINLCIAAFQCHNRNSLLIKELDMNL